MSYSFPTSPSDGDRYPANPGVSGKVQFQWSESLGVWEVVQSTIRSNNQLAFNEYIWPISPEEDDYQLTSTSGGVLSWTPAAIPVVKSLSLLEPFNGSRTQFTLVGTGTTTPFLPTPPENLIVFLGGVPQITGAAYSVTGSQIVFTEAPALGTIFSAVTLVNLAG